MVAHFANRSGLELAQFLLQPLGGCVSRRHAHFSAPGRMVDAARVPHGLNGRIPVPGSARRSRCGPASPRTRPASCERRRGGGAAALERGRVRAGRAQLLAPGVSSRGSSVAQPSAVRAPVKPERSARSATVPRGAWPRPESGRSPGHVQALGSAARRRHATNAPAGCREEPGPRGLTARLEPTGPASSRGRG